MSIPERNIAPFRIPTVSTLVSVDKNTVFVTKRGTLNFIEGTNVGLTVVDDPSNDSADVTISAIGAGVTPAALTKIDDTNVTLTLTGSPTVALLAATGLTLGWNGTLADARLSTTAVVAGSYGSATQVGTFTVSATGRLTAASNITITPAAGSITGAGNLTVGTSLQITSGSGTGATLVSVGINTIQGIRTVDSPTFDSLTLNNVITSLYVYGHIIGDTSLYLGNSVANSHITLDNVPAITYYSDLHDFRSSNGFTVFLQMTSSDFKVNGGKVTGVSSLTLRGDTAALAEVILNSSTSKNTYLADTHVWQDSSAVELFETSGNTYSNGILYVGNTKVIARIASVATGQWLKSQGTTSAPVYASITASDVTSAANLSVGTSLQFTSGTGTGIVLAAATINTIQGIRTVDSPTFAGVLTAFIAPTADSTTAVKITKADTTTTVMTFDTTNRRVGIGATPSTMLDIRPNFDSNYAFQFDKQGTNVAIEMIALDTAGTCFMDWRVAGGDSDYDFRTQRATGANGNLTWTIKGTGTYVWVTNTSTTAANLDSTGNYRQVGYLRSGSTSAPTNTTAGDITGVRAHLGADGTMRGSVTLSNSSSATTQFLGALSLSTENTLASGSIVADNILGSLAFYNNNGTVIAGITAHYATAANGSACYMSFKTGNTADQVRIDTSGQVGIGTGTNTINSILEIRASSPIFTVTKTGVSVPSYINFQAISTSQWRVGWSGTTSDFGIYDAISGKTVIRHDTTNLYLLESSGNVMIGGTGTPTNIISVNGNSARTWWMERHTTSNTAGNNLTIQGGGATSGATNKAGGALILIPGIGTGNANPATLQIQTYLNTGSGTSDDGSLTSRWYFDTYRGASPTNGNYTQHTYALQFLGGDSGNGDNVAGAIAIGSAGTTQALLIGTINGANTYTNEFTFREDGAFAANKSITVGSATIGSGKFTVDSTGKISGYNNAAPGSGKLLRGDGTYYVETTPTYPNSGTEYQVLVGDGTNYVEDFRGTGVKSWNGTASIANSETAIFSSGTFRADRIKADSYLRVTLIGTCTSTAAGAGVFHIRYGTAGTTADANVCTFTLAGAATSGTNVLFRVVMDVDVITAGASGSHDGTLFLVNNGTTGISTTVTQLIRRSDNAPSYSVTNGIFTITYISGNASTTSTFKVGLIEIVHK